MPTYEAEERFWREYHRLSAEQRAAFHAAVAKLVADLRKGTFRKGLRIKRFEGSSDTWEMTWADNGRALFRYGPSIHPGKPHVIWLRIGGHEIFEER
jgi:hypothetical protein